MIALFCRGQRCQFVYGLMTSNQSQLSSIVLSTLRPIIFTILLSTDMPFLNLNRWGCRNYWSFLATPNYLFSIISISYGNTLYFYIQCLIVNLNCNFLCELNPSTQSIFMCIFSFGRNSLCISTCTEVTTLFQ